MNGIFNSGAVVLSDDPTITPVGRGRLVCEDDFRNGPSGWVQLLDGNTGAGVVYLDTEIAYRGSPYSLYIGTEDYSSADYKPWGYATAIKRLSRGATVNKIYAEWWFGYGSLYGENTPKAIDFGIDQATPAATRRYFKFRWLNYDEGTAARVSKFQMSHTSSWVDVPSGAVNLGYNENKRNLWHVEAVVDIDDGVYDGLRVNGTGFGSLASTPSSALRSYGPSSSTLAQFASGFNATIDVVNRLNTNSTKAWANLAYFRAVEIAS